MSVDIKLDGPMGFQTEGAATPTDTNENNTITQINKSFAQAV